MTVHEQIADLRKNYTGKKFMGMPDAWMDKPHYWCNNSHRSTFILKSERKGDLCLACHENVRLGPSELEGREPL